MLDCPHRVPVVHRIGPFVHTRGVNTAFIGRIALSCAAGQTAEIVTWPPGPGWSGWGWRGCSWSVVHGQRFVM